MRLECACLSVVALVSVALSPRLVAAQETIFESASPPTMSAAGDYAFIDNRFWQGVLFTTTEDHLVTALGGVVHVDNEGTELFVAVFPTNGTTPPAPPNIDDAVFVELVAPPVFPGTGALGAEDLPDTRVELDTELMLPAGDWYICFGSGAAGATSGGKIRNIDTEIGTPLYVNKNSHGWNGPIASRRFRFFVEGIALTGPRCGDGVAHPVLEECDDGNASNRDSCLNDCRRASCGDGYRSTEEECDDGNLADDDGCSATCQLPDAPAEPRNNTAQGSASGCGVAAHEGARDAPAPMTVGVVALLMLRRRRRDALPTL